MRRSSNLAQIFTPATVAATFIVTYRNLEGTPDGDLKTDPSRFEAKWHHHISTTVPICQRVWQHASQAGFHPIGAILIQLIQGELDFSTIAINKCC